MKLNNVVLTAPKVGQTFGGGEDTAKRQARMRAFWSEAVNAVLFPVGRLLGMTVDAKGTTIADLVAKGEEIEMDAITVDGKSLPLQPGFKLSLRNVKAWGCIACASAHGTGVKPSQAVSVKGLLNNKFYYRPSDRALFVISDTCWSDYVKGLNAATAARFISPSEYKAPALKTAPAKA